MQKTIASIIKSPTAKKFKPLPDIAQKISKKIFIFEPNYLFKNMKLIFEKPDEAQLDLNVVYESEPRITMVGLDGLYRKSLQGPPIMARGEWSDDKTFLIWYNTGPNLWTIQIHFEQDQLHLKIGDLWDFVATEQSIDKYCSDT